MKKNTLYISFFSLIMFIGILFNSCAKKEESDDSATTSSSVSSENLVINEISSTKYNNVMPWFEIYNKGTTSAKLNDFSLKSLSVASSANLNYIGDSTTFSLPSVEIPAGGYLIIRGKYNTTYEIDESATFIELADSSGNSPAWGSSGGFLELIKDGKTIDFVKFGTSSATPTTTDEWSGDAAANPEFWEFGRSIARDSSSSDTNTSNDWAQRKFATFGGKNDVPETCTSDDDRDGIPDCSEESSTSTFAGINLYSFGARLNQKDIFVEIDYMDSDDPGITPRKEALDKVKSVFAKANYSIHFDVGDLIDKASGIDPDDYDLGGGNSITYSACLKLRKTEGCGAYVDDIKYKNFDMARKSIFYYMVFGNSQNSDGSAGSSGLAEKPGNDSIVTIGSWNLNTSSTNNINQLNNFMAGTVLHEFGHNLDLGHGGDSSVNYKPNYLSSMNYLYQLEGLPPDNKTGDRYFYANFNDNSNCGSIKSKSDLNSGPYDSNMVIGFSDGSGQTLTESSQAESVGLGRNSATAVDFNCDGDTSDTVSMNLNPEYDSTSNTSTDNLTDYNDWGNITIIHNQTYSGQQTRSFRNFYDSNFDNQVVLDPTYNDRQPIAEETPPSPEFFKRLNEVMSIK